MNERKESGVMVVLTDTDKMPFGKYKGKMMQDVPASYLHYLWTNGMTTQTKCNPVANYIERNLLGLMDQYKNGVWR